MSGKLFIQWRHSYCAVTARKRYIDKEVARQAHKEIVNLFFPQEEHDESDESHTDEKSEKSGKSICDSSSLHSSGCPFASQNLNNKQNEH